MVCGRGRAKGADCQRRASATRRSDSLSRASIVASLIVTTASPRAQAGVGGDHQTPVGQAVDAAQFGGVLGVESGEEVAGGGCHLEAAGDCLGPGVVGAGDLPAQDGLGDFQRQVDGLGGQPGTQFGGLGLQLGEQLVDRGGQRCAHVGDGLAALLDTDAVPFGPTFLETLETSRLVERVELLGPRPDGVERCRRFPADQVDRFGPGRLVAPNENVAGSCLCWAS